MIKSYEMTVYGHGLVVGCAEIVYYFQVSIPVSNLCPHTHTGSCDTLPLAGLGHPHIEWQYNQWPWAQAEPDTYPISTDSGWEQAEARYHEKKAPHTHPKGTALCGSLEESKRGKPSCMYIYAPNVPPVGLEVADMYHNLQTSDIWFLVISM